MATPVLEQLSARVFGGSVVGLPRHLPEEPYYLAMAFTVYVLRNLEGRLYIGHTHDLEQRLAQHQSGTAHWTKRRGPWTPVYTETFATRAEAMRRERALKSGRLNQELRDRLKVERVLPGKD